jgi:hypothetical protein
MGMGEMMRRYLHRRGKKDKHSREKILSDQLLLTRCCFKFDKIKVRDRERERASDI